MSRAVAVVLALGLGVAWYPAVQGSGAPGPVRAQEAVDTPAVPTHPASGHPGADAPALLLIRVEGAVSPTTTNYIRRAIVEARERGAPALIIELDTPGGLLESTQNIVRELFAADLPTVVYVAPVGARAASAGTFITLAAHVAAMAPSTTIGAASPVTMAPGAQADSVMQRKLLQATESFMETIAERRGRNLDWSISAVREGASATERQALELGVIDLVADSRESLLDALDGREADGVALRTAGTAIEELPMNLAERLLGTLMRPEVLLILMMVALYGIMTEVTNPGGIVPGVAGVIALVLLLYASAAMPINTAGLILLVLAVGLFIAEAFTPTFGLLLAAGAVAFFLGGLMLFQDFPEAMELSWVYLVPVTLLTVAFFAWVVTAGIRAQLGPRRTGVETMPGERAEVIDAVGPEGGRVFFQGEYWHAVSDEEIPVGAACEVVEVRGLTMRVKPVQLLNPDRSE